MRIYLLSLELGGRGANIEIRGVAYIEIRASVFKALPLTGFIQCRSATIFFGHDFDVFEWYTRKLHVRSLKLSSHVYILHEYKTTHLIPVHFYCLSLASICPSMGPWDIPFL